MGGKYGRREKLHSGILQVKKAYTHGFSISPEGVLSLERGEGHFLVLGVFNSYRKGYAWGRLHFQAELPKGSICIVRGFAVEGEGCIKDMVLYNPGDNFMQTFPEINQEPGGFFHRYMSVFSTLYFEMGQAMEGMETYLDVNLAPDFMLPNLARWLGIDIPQGLLEENTFRKFLREAYDLNRRKGTKEAMSRIVELMLGVKPVIVEGNCHRGEGVKKHQKLDKLFGDNIWDITILVFYPPKERVREQLLYLLLQFKPARCPLRLIFCGPCQVLDSYGFLDTNAVLAKESYTLMDGGFPMDGSAVLIDAKKIEKIKIYGRHSDSKML